MGIEKSLIRVHEGVPIKFDPGHINVVRPLPAAQGNASIFVFAEAFTRIPHTGVMVDKTCLFGL